MGFAAGAWKGGQARETWLKDGKLRSPGWLHDFSPSINRPGVMFPFFRFPARRGQLKGLDDEA